jgi:hypothetical protein
MLSPRDRLYFLHIPKTAGTTLKPILDARFDEAEICPAELWRDLIKLPWDAIPGYRFFRGHFGWRRPGDAARPGAAGHDHLPAADDPLRPLDLPLHPARAETRASTRSRPRWAFSDFVADPRPRRNLSNVQVRNLSFTLATDPRLELAKVEQKTPWDIATRLEQLAAWLPPEEKLRARDRAAAGHALLRADGPLRRVDGAARLHLRLAARGTRAAAHGRAGRQREAGGARGHRGADPLVQQRSTGACSSRREPLFEGRAAAMLGELAELGPARRAAARALRRRPGAGRDVARPPLRARADAPPAPAGRARHGRLRAPPRRQRLAGPRGDRLSTPACSAGRARHTEST